MKEPWAKKTGLAKATSIFATIALISLGLCGANVLAFSTIAESLGAGFMLVTAYVELAGILIGVVGLVVVLVMRSGREE